MTKKEFISEVVNELLENKFSIFLHQKINVEECGGWFDCENKELLVALDNPMGFEILIHEFSHYLQWKNHKDWFLKHNGGVGILFGWLETTNYSEDILDLAWRDTVAIELHCEEQSVWLIETKDLPVDLDKYKRAANAYLLFYQFVRSKRLWSKKSPYNNPKLLELMPTELYTIDYYLDPANVTDEMRDLFEECFIE